MEEHLDINQALRVYDKVVSHGNKRDDKYYHHEFTAWSDLDGYTVHLADEHVTLSIYFHNKYQFDYDNSNLLEAFLNKIKALDESE